MPKPATLPPTSLPAADQAGTHTDTAIDHTTGVFGTEDVFSFAATTAVAAAAAVAPDVGDPPGSVLDAVLSEVAPHLPVDFPDGGAAGIAHAADHVPATHPIGTGDWFV